MVHDPDRPTGSRLRLRQGALLALMALAGSLIFVLPEPNDETFELSSEQESTIQIAPDSGPGAQRFSGSETGEEGDELALAPESGDDMAAPQFAEPEPDGVAFEALSAGSDVPTTTEPPSAPVVEDTSTTEAPTTTAQPPTTIEADESAETTTEGPTTTSAPDPEQSDADSTAAENTEGAAEETGEGEPTGDTAGESDGTTVTTVAEGAETTEPPATDPPETAPPETEPPADPAYVDAGNGVMVPPVLLAIRFCESTDNYTAANPSSSARGAYQFLTGSWDAYGHKDRYGVNQAHLATPAQQDEAALLTWERDGTRPWNASKSCWSKRI
jgi:hypothetical protein